MLPKPVRTLPAETARKIAAGEVIDRPSAIVRELLDNAIDSNADSVSVEITNGGIDSVRITDNGFGMTKEDLSNSAYPHATSKIVSENDLQSLSTLGFRGEALVSIAAVCRLEITSVRDEETAYKLEIEGSTRKLNPTNWSKGTAVQASGLFENFPARRVFLKKPASEAKLCKQIFIEKALPWNEIGFKFIQDGKLKLDLQPHQTLTERFLSSFEITEPEELFHEIKKDSDENFNFSIIIGNAEVRRSDKKHILIFINGRRIFEYSLVQAIEYGAQGYFPNGTYPVAALFLHVNPNLVDFNIHPAKKEVRFKDINPIHHAVSTAVRDFFKDSAIAGILSDTLSDNFSDSFSADVSSVSSADFSYDFSADSGICHTTQSEQSFCEQKLNFPELQESTERNGSYYNPLNKPKLSEEARNNLNDFINVSAEEKYSATKNFVSAGNDSYSETYKPSYNNFNGREADLAFEKGFQFYGTALGTFLLAEKNSVLYLIDQHAAHERILFNKFMNSLGTKQKLLFPYIIETESVQDDEYIASLVPEMKKIGFDMNRKKNNWEVLSIPAKWNGSEKDLENDLLLRKIEPQQIVHSIAATSSCRAAVKDGTILDYETARNLAMEALELPDPHCPHGRPIFIILPKTELFKMIRRTE